MKGPGCDFKLLKLWLHVQFLHAMQFLQRSPRIAGNSKVMHAKIAHVTMALQRVIYPPHAGANDFIAVEVP